MGDVLGRFVGHERPEVVGYYLSGMPARPFTPFGIPLLESRLLAQHRLRDRMLIVAGTNVGYRIPAANKQQVTGAVLPPAPPRPGRCAWCLRKRNDRLVHGRHLITARRKPHCIAALPFSQTEDWSGGNRGCRRHQKTVRLGSVHKIIPRVALVPKTGIHGVDTGSLSTNPLRRLACGFFGFTHR